VRSIAKVLNASAILEGSVRRSGRRLRINVQLTNAEDGYQLWSERFDREIDDVFAVQNEIADRVTLALRVPLADGERSMSNNRSREFGGL
jgi:TolB-like protein